MVWRYPHVLDMNPTDAAIFLNDRPITVHGEWRWPKDAIHEWIASLTA